MDRCRSMAQGGAQAADRRAAALSTPTSGRRDPSASPPCSTWTIGKVERAHRQRLLAVPRRAGPSQLGDPGDRARRADRACPSSSGKAGRWNSASGRRAIRWNAASGTFLFRPTAPPSSPTSSSRRSSVSTRRTIAWAMAAASSTGRWPAMPKQAARHRRRLRRKQDPDHLSAAARHSDGRDRHGLNERGRGLRNACAVGRNPSIDRGLPTVRAGAHHVESSDDPGRSQAPVSRQRGCSRPTTRISERSICCSRSWPGFSAPRCRW